MGEEFIDWSGYSDGVDYNTYTPQQDFSGVSDYASNSYDYNAPQVDYNSYVPQQDATPYWETTFTQTPADYSFGSSTYGMGMGGSGAGLGYAVTPSAASPAFGATFGTGGGAAPGMVTGQAGSSSYTLGAAPTQGGITGSGPGIGDMSFGPNFNRLGFGTAGAEQPGLLTQARDGFAALSKFGRENADLVKFGTGLVSALAGQSQMNAAKRQQAQSNEQMNRELAMREKALASQMEALQENQQLARQTNQQATQSFDEARSLYNPQEMAIRGMAQQKAATERDVANLRQQLQRRGLSQAAIDAEIRRARLGGSTAATTAYTKGLDVGRTAQQQALTSAKGLQTNVPGLSYTPSSAAADYFARQAVTSQQQGDMTSAQMTKLLEDYLGQPTKTVQEARTKAAGATAK